ncbi:MAG: methyltransferase domain-containing protein [Myxococcaceae bacterium]|nr:methyltransferase domain-containing protein [Myxococcaceae bacterium]
MVTSSLFHLAARFYGWMTAQKTWRDHCQKLVEGIPTDRPLRIVDLGCGPGVSTFEIARVRPAHDTICGLDFARGMLEEAKRRARDPENRDLPAGRITWLRGDAGRLPFRDGSIDVLTGHSFLYLLPDRAAALRECRRVLRPGGRLVLMEPNRTPSIRKALRVSRNPPFLLSMILWRPFSRLYGRFTPEALAEILDAAGFKEARAEETLAGMGLLARAIVP